MASWAARAPRSNRQSVDEPSSRKLKLTTGNPELMDEYMKTVSNLTTTQKELVKDMDLLTYTSALRSYRFDNRFTAWLLGRFHHMNQFHVDPSSPYIIGPDDVSKIFGFNNNGKSVINGVNDKSYETKESIRARLMDHSSEDSWEAAAKRIVSNVTNPRSAEEQDSFKTAFAVYTLLVLLGEGDTNAIHPPNFVPALKVPSDFRTYNWAEFIFHEFTIEALNVRCATRSGNEFSPSFGVTLFAHVSSHHHNFPYLVYFLVQIHSHLAKLLYIAQVYYFDNKFFSEDTQRSLQTPRMQFYGGDKFSKLVMADTSGLVGTEPSRVFGAAKVIA
jgi:hypothetical protein